MLLTLPLPPKTVALHEPGPGQQRNLDELGWLEDPRPCPQCGAAYVSYRPLSLLLHELECFSGHRSLVLWSEHGTIIGSYPRAVALAAALRPFSQGALAYYSLRTP